MNALEITTKLMTIGQNREKAGILSKYVYPTLKWREVKFLKNGMVSTKDDRNGKWGDDPTCNLYADIIDLFPVIATFN